MPLHFMGCFATSNSKAEKQCASKASTTRYRKTPSTVVVTRDSLSLLSNKPVELPDPDQLLGRQSFLCESEPWTTNGKAPVVTRIRFQTPFATRAAFSGPLMSNATQDETITSQTRLQPPGLPLSNEFVYCSDVEGGKRNGRTLRRTASFGGRPQPLPLPVADVLPISNLRRVYNLPLPVPEDFDPPTATRVRAPATRIFKLEAGNTVARGGGRVTGVSRGLPLPPPSLVTKLLQPSLAAFDFRQLALSTDNFAASHCVLKSAAGDVFRARISKDSSGAAHFQAKLDVAVLRLPENSQQGVTEWKCEVQLLSQISHRNVCALMGYCAHEAGSSFSPRASSRQERLLVFAQPANGSLYDHLFGSRSSLDWTTRVNIALGAARGLLYIQNRAPVQIVFKEFSASAVLLENNYTPKLAGYGLSVAVPLVRRSSSFSTTLIRSQLQAKLNVRSFGVLLLELVTGKNSRDAIYFGDDANFLHWGRQCMKQEEEDEDEDEEEESWLAQIVDPRMRGVCPTKGATELVSLSLRCASKREAQRPSLLEVIGALKSIKARYCDWNCEEIRVPPSLNNRSSPSEASSSENEDVGILSKKSATPGVAYRSGARTPRV